MAQVTITHYRETTPEFRRSFQVTTREIVGSQFFGLEPDKITSDDLSVRTLIVDTDASAAGADAEIHVEIAQGDQPRDECGDLLSPEASEERLDTIAKSIGGLVCRNIEVRVAVWLTCYTKSGWSSHVSCSEAANPTSDQDIA